jgi:hypothetical protein
MNEGLCLVEILYLSLSPGSGSEFKQHILSPGKVRNVCYSLAEL